MKQVTDIFENCLYFTSGQLFREISALAEESFAPLGLSPSYAYVLMVVFKEKKISTSRAAEKVGLKPSTLTRLADKLVRRGFIAREQEGRNNFLIRTKKLDHEIGTIYSCWENLYHSYNEILGKENATMLNKKISKANKRFG